DGARVVSGSNDTTSKLWDAATGALLRTFEGHSDKITSVAFSPDNGQVLGSGGKTISLWDAITGRQLRAYKGNVYSVKAVAFSPNGTHVLAGGWQFVENNRTMGELNLWDAATGALLRNFDSDFRGKGSNDEFSSIAVSPDGRRVVSGAGNSTVKLWDASSGV